MVYRPILLVEDNPDDEALTLRALGKNRVLKAAVELIRQGAADYILKDRPARLVPVSRRALAEAWEGIRRDPEEIERAGHRVTRLVHQLLAAGSREVIRAELIDLNQLVGGIDELRTTVVSWLPARTSRPATVPGRDHGRAQPEPAR